MGQVIESLYFIDGKRPRTDQTHFAKQNVIKLRELVQAEFAKPFSDGSDTRIVSDFKDGTAHLIHGSQLVLELFGIRDHGAKFVNIERVAVQPGALLAE